MDHGRTAVLGYDTRVAGLLSRMLVRGGFEQPQHSVEAGVATIGSHAPQVLLIDFDHLRSDCLETLRQLRFVLPDCTIVVLTSTIQTKWAKECHLAGASGVLALDGSESGMLDGLKHAIRTGCFTDASFAGGHAT